MVRHLLRTVLVLFLAATASAQTYQQGDLTAAATTFEIDVANRGTATIQVAGTFVGTITFEVSTNRLTWVGVDCFTPADPSTPVNSTTSTGLWSCPVAGLRGLRARMSAYTSGTATVYLSAAAGGGGSGGGGGGTYSATDTAHLAAIELATEAVQTAVETGNSSISKLSAGTTEDEFEIKATAGVLASIVCRNYHATNTAILKLVQATAANTTPGSSTIWREFVIPAGPSGNNSPPLNLSFSPALTGYIVLGKTAAAVDEVAADDVRCDVEYR